MSFTVSITLTDKEYAEVKLKAEEAGLNIAQYVKRHPIGEDEFSARYDFLIATAKAQPHGSSFTVMSLFSDWNDIQRGVKLSLGRNFYHLVKRGEVLGVAPDGKNKSNVQLYKRV